jgi:hypothetical protein
MSQITVRKTRSPDSLLYDALFQVSFDAQASIAASQATSTVVSQLPLTVSCKIMAATVTYSASVSGGALFNIVVGGGTYEGTTTAGVVSRGTFTITGAPLTGQNNTYTMNGIAIACPQTTGNSVTQQAVADIAVLNAAAFSSTANAWVGTTTPEGYAFSNAAGVITYTALGYGPAYNITPTVNAGAGGDAVAVVASTGGVLPNPVPTVAQSDQFWLSGAHNFAAAGNSVYPFDQGIQPGYPYVAQYFPVPTPQFDVLYQQGQVLTLRMYTPTSATLTNFKVALLLKTLDVIETHPSNLNNFAPVRDIR